MQGRALDAARRLGDGFTSATPVQKLLVLLAVAGLVLGGTAFTRWASAPQFTPLFTNLAADDASAIVEQLDAEGVPYELADGGASVLVPQERVYDLRLAMSAEGLPSSDDTGYSLLDEQGVTASQFQQQVTYQRALEGELAKTVGSIAGLVSATVHLAIPQDDVFLEESAAPTASVVVQPARGAELDDRQVNAVVHLVSSAVEGMAPEDVQVIDASGEVLSAQGAAAGGGRDSATGEYETRVRGQIQAMLDRIVGPGAAVAAVTAELDLDATDTTSETFSAEEGVPPLSESTTSEDYDGTGGAATGVLGPDNIQVPGGTAGGAGTYAKDSTTRNNAVNKVTERRVGAPGSLRRQSVSVVLDTAKAGTVDLVALEEAVSTAAGIDAARGDTVAVNRMAFDASGADALAEQGEAAAAAAAAAQQDQLVRTAVLGAVVVLLLLVAAIGARRRAKRARKAEEERWEQVLDPALALPGGAAAAIGDGAVPALPAAEPAPDPGLEVRREVEALVERQPDEVAELLRGWLADRRS